MRIPERYIPAGSIFSEPHQRIFLSREYDSLKGARARVLVMLTAILTLSLLCVVTGKAGLDYLNEKMNDPFTKWISIPVSNSSHQNQYMNIKNYLDSCATNDVYTAVFSSGSYRTDWGFFRKDEPGTTFSFVQSFSLWQDTLLISAIINDKENLIHLFEDAGKLNSDAFRDGIIITQKLLEELNCSHEELAQKKVVIQNADNLPLRVLAVVRALPNKSQVLCENKLLRSVADADESNIVPEGENTEFSIYFYALDDDEAKRLVADVERILNDFGLQAGVSKLSEWADFVSQNRVVTVAVPRPLGNDVKRRLQVALTENLFRNNAIIAFEHNVQHSHPDVKYGIPSAANNYDDIFDYLSINFDNLSYIGDFQRNVYERFRIELDLDQIEAKKNFAVISFLATFLIVSLVTFSVLAVLLFLTNLMRNHLERIRVNLGTLLAFGLSQRFLFRGYMFILLRMVLLSCVVSVLIIAGIRFITLNIIDPLLAVPELFKYQLVFSNLWLWASLIILHITLYSIFRRQLRKFLSHPPGDLIYGRV